MNTSETSVNTVPIARLRRTRMTAALRSMVRETELSKNDFIYPLFVVPGTKVKREVSSMQAVYQMSVDEIVRECVAVKTMGIPAVILFGIPKRKMRWGQAPTTRWELSSRPFGPSKRKCPRLSSSPMCVCASIHRMDTAGSSGGTRS